MSADSHIQPLVKAKVTPKESGKPVVLIATDDPLTSAYIGKHLSRVGFSTRIAIYDSKMLHDAPRRAPTAVLMCFKDHVESAPKVLKSLKERYAPHDLTIVGAFPDPARIDASLYDSVIFPPAHPAQIAGRVNALIRLGAMQREISLRIETLKSDFGIDYEMSAPAIHTPFRVLFIGKASPEFMVIINALEAKNVEVIAAFTSFSAFDFLHDTPFNAVVMNTLTSNEPAFTISETMRRNSKLYHTPTLLLTGDGFDSHDEAYRKGASDIIPFGSTQDEISGRILELANYHRLHQHLKGDFDALGGPRCIDEASGTYNKLFFFAHLRRVRAAQAELGAPTTLILIRIRPKTKTELDPTFIEAAYDQIGRMINHMVRMEDIVARIDDNIYAAAFPGQDPDKMHVVVSRLEGMVSSAAFRSGVRKSDSFQVELDISLSGLGPADKTPAILNELAKTAKKTTDIRQVG